MLTSCVHHLRRVFPQSDGSVLRVMIGSLDPSALSNFCNSFVVLVVPLVLELIVFPCSICSSIPSVHSALGMVEGPSVPL